MICPSCQADNDGPGICFQCGHPMSVITQGTVLASRYEILGRLGKGGMGTVYKAQDRDLDETVALKVLRSDIEQSPDLVRRFRSEIKLARKVSHRNVCRIHEYGQHGDLRFISMELMEGVDLKHILQERGPLPPGEAFEASIQIARGLSAIHEQGIVHRDLKTPNIMKDARGTIRLMDFGIAKDLEAAGLTGATAIGQIVGTPEYMSPEQVRGLKLDARSDIYALGIVVFEVFTGDVPFRGDSPLATLLKQVDEPPPLDGPAARKLPIPLLPLLAKMLAKEPADRYASAEDVADALRSARDEALPLGWSAPLPAPIRTAAAPLEEVAPGTAVLPTPVPTAVRTVVPTAPTMPAPRRQPVAPPPLPRPSPPPPSSPGGAPARDRGTTAPASAGLLRAVAIIGAISVVACATGVAWFLMANASGRPQAAPVPSRTLEPPASIAAGPPVSIPAEPPAAIPDPEPPVSSLAPARVPQPAPSRAAPTPTGVQSREASDGSRETGGARSRTPAPKSSPLAVIPLVRIPNASSAAPEGKSVPGPVVAGAADGESAGEAGSGVLRIGVRPWAEVTLDGRVIGTTPVRPLTLAEGAHVLKLVHPDFQPVLRKVTVRRGETVKVQVDFSLVGIPR